MVKFITRTVTLSATCLILALAQGCGDSGTAEKKTTQAGTANSSRTPDRSPNGPRSGWSDDAHARLGRGFR